MSSSHEWIGIDPEADNPPAHKTAGQVAYEAWAVSYCRRCGVPYYQAWDANDPWQKAAWHAAAAAVLHHNTAP